MDNRDKALVREVTKLLQGGTAHADFKTALKGLPKTLRGEKPEKLPYSIWQLVEHIRIAQWDMVHFCLDSKHKSPKWPDEYWPKELAPKSDAAWKESVDKINTDLDEFIDNFKECADPYAKISGGDGQTLLQEALQIADHNAYHIAEIIVIRRLLDAWH